MYIRKSFLPYSFRLSSALLGDVSVYVEGVCSCDCEMNRVSPGSSHPVYLVLVHVQSCGVDVHFVI